MVAVIPKLDHVATIGKARLTERGKPKLGRPLSFSQRTFAALRQLIFHRHDGPCDTDDWAWQIGVVLPLLLQIAKDKGHPKEWVRQTATEVFPGLAECCDDWWDQEVEEASIPTGIQVDTIAARMGIREVELRQCFGADKRKRCGLVSIDRPRKVRAKEREKNKNIRKRLKRSSKHLICLLSDQHWKPWESEGLSRRAWYYRRAKAGKFSTDCTEMTPNTLTIQVGGQKQCNRSTIPAKTASRKRN